MKKITLFFFLVLVLCFSLQAQNVGIGTTTPTYPLTVISDGSSKGIVQKAGTTEVGFYVSSGGNAYLQTWSPTDLYFTTNNGTAKIAIANATGFVGIATTSPTAQLDVNGAFRLRGNGAGAGKVLTSDATGSATWNGSVAFSATGTYQANPVTNTSTIVLYNTELFDDGSNYNPSTAKFTAPIAGTYHFDASIRLQTGIPPNDSEFRIFVNNVVQRSADMDFGFVQISSTLKLNAGDVVDIRYYYSDSNIGNAPIAASPLYNNFSGFLVR